MPDAVVLVRIFLAADSSVKAVYSDNSLFLLSKDGSTFSNIDFAGNCVTQLSLFAIKRYRCRLAEVVKFRNLHVQPALHIPDLQTSSFSLGYKIATVSWPGSAAEAKHAGMLRFEADGSVILDSEDTAARVVLHPNQNRVAVCFPLLLPSNGSSKHQYSWQTQLFAISETPHQWHYPLQLLHQAIAADTAGQQQTDSEERWSPVESGDRTSQLPAAVSPDTAVHAFPRQSWWRDCSHMLPHGIEILLEWTPDALYQYMPETAQVAGWIHADESCLLAEADGKFVRHFRNRQQPVRLYAAEAVPVHTDDGGSTRYPLAQFAEHAFALRQLNASSKAGADQQALALSQMSAEPLDESNLPCEATHEVHEQHEVAECGKFTAFRDGSVHVSFNDRTLLYMELSHKHCNIVTPEGHRVIVATASPVGVETYVAQAVEFAEWAFSTPAERAVVLQQSASIQKELRKCSRAAALCEWAQGKLMQSSLKDRDHEEPSVHASHKAPGNEMSGSQATFASENASDKSVLCDLAAPSEREIMIQALLAKSGHLLSTLL